MLLDDLPPETLDAIASLLPKPSLRALMHHSPILWRVCRRRIFRHFHARPHPADRLAFESAIAFLDEIDDIGPMVLALTICGDRNTRSRAVDISCLHRDVLRKLLNRVTRIETLSLIKIDWASSWETWTWYPIAAWPVGYKLKAISVERSRSTQGPEGVLALAQLGRVVTIRVQDVYWWRWPLPHKTGLPPTSIPRRMILDGPESYLDNITRTVPGSVTELVLRNFCHRFTNAEGLKMTLSHLSVTLTSLTIWNESMQCVYPPTTRSAANCSFLISAFARVPRERWPGGYFQPSSPFHRLHWNSAAKLWNASSRSRKLVMVVDSSHRHPGPKGYDQAPNYHRSVSNPEANN